MYEHDPNIGDVVNFIYWAVWKESGCRVDCRPKLYNLVIDKFVPK